LQFDLKRVYGTLTLQKTRRDRDAQEEEKGLESVQVLRRVWQQYYEVAGGKVKWRAGPQAEEGEGVIRSPYDPEAQTGKKRKTV
jgi:hypothetical protein